PAASSTPIYKVGLTNEPFATTTPQHLVDGAYFAATSTNTWRAVVKNGNSLTIVDTGVGTSTTNNGVVFQKMRVEVTATNVTFLINGTVVTVINSSTGSAILTPLLSVGLLVGNGLPAVQPRLYATVIRYWIDDPVDGGSSKESLPEFVVPSFDRVSGAEISFASVADQTKSYIPGMVISSATSSSGSWEVVRSSGRYDNNLFGAVSTASQTVIGQEASTTIRVGQTGRMPVIVSLENGPIHEGDRIAASSIEGVGMKATRPGMVLGRALENFDSATTTASTTLAQVVCDSSVDDELRAAGVFVPENSCVARVMVQLEQGADFTVGDMVQDALGNVVDMASAMAELAVAKGAEFARLVVGELVAKVAVIGNLFADHITANVIDADQVNTKELCIEGVCITKTQLQDILDGAGVPQAQASTGGDEGGDNGGDTGTTTPEGDTEAPVISLNGNNPAQIYVGDSYTDLGATVSDNVDENLGFKVSLNGGAEIDLSQLSLDTSTSTSYSIVFSSTDQAGNTGTATRTVNVVTP
ncbi:MAG: immunoglobulin-like domain-containing protein, partial [Patescibacteria group bacterium]